MKLVIQNSVIIWIIPKPAYIFVTSKEDVAFMYKFVVKCITLGSVIV